MGAGGGSRGGEPGEERGRAHRAAWRQVGEQRALPDGLVAERQQGTGVVEVELHNTARLPAVLVLQRVQVKEGPSHAPAAEGGRRVGKELGIPGPGGESSFPQGPPQRQHICRGRR